MIFKRIFGKLGISRPLRVIIVLTIVSIILFVVGKAIAEMIDKTLK